MKVFNGTLVRQSKVFSFSYIVKKRMFLTVIIPALLKKLIPPITSFIPSWV